jgi:hypothetical protein
MKQENLIPAIDFCQFHNIEYSFIHLLDNAGLIQIISIKDADFIQEEEMKKLEKLIRLHYDLEINIEGIETIEHLIENIIHLQNKVLQLQNKLEGFPQES